uniref:ATP synthase F0 subunit 8 n=1 Tax=Rathkea octopunctata TaxID=367925 RepID=A0A0S2IAU6_9CNID|nr:ATP synthase F0 subunit 8 [Rathkea octopunctata]
MSQLDFSITFTHFFGFLFCFYIFTHYLVVVLVRFWYNQKLRDLTGDELTEELKRVDNSVFIKRILKL